MTSTSDVAKAFTAMLKAGDHHGAAEAFNAQDIVSIEAMDGPMARVQGMDAIRAKGEWWYANHEVHAVTTEGPYVNGDSFVVTFAMDITPKATGERMQSTEAALYTVKNGKIVEERFFY
jgi:ketosteroid isomerase-like protein